MRRSLLHVGKKFARVACGVVLATSLVPMSAFGTGDLRSGSVGASDDMALRAARIDAASDSFEQGSMIVVYRQGALPSNRAEKGMSAQSVHIAGIPDASAQVLSADAGTPGGGAAFHVDLPQGMSVGQAVAAAERDPDVVVAQPNYRYYLLEDREDSLEGIAHDGQSGQSAPAVTAEGPYPLPNDPVVGESANDTAQTPVSANQWWIHAVNAPQAWSMAHGDDNPVAVAVLDTGISFDHEDLANNILTDYAYDAYYDQKLTQSIDDDEMAHGCHVAGIVAAEADNARGIAGVSYNAKVLPIRVFHLAFNAAQMREVATCSDEDLIRAYDYLLSDNDGNGMTVAQETGTRVVNMSLGGYLQDGIDAGEDPEEAYDYLFEDKIEQAEAAGILTVAAAGNGDDFGNARTDASYPSDYPCVMSVVALRTADTRTQWSDHNAMKNIAAPGNNVYSTYWTGNPPYKFMSGTSMATPVVAGCAALLWAYDPTLTVRDVKDVLYGTADDLGAEGFDEYYGWGRVNIGAALSSLGTATVALRDTTMVRTTTQTLSASQISNRSAVHTWRWSVDDPSVARVSQDGVLTALAPGRVVVTATAVDDLSVSGHRTVEVQDIAIPGSVTASANPQMNMISLSWEEAPAATGYRVLRATAAPGTTDEPGEFADLGSFEASGLTQDAGVTFSDTSAQPSDLYWYKVVPLGQLDGEVVEGEGAVSNRCFYTEKGPLKQSIDEAEGLLASTQASADGTDVPATSFWTPSGARDALNLALMNAYGAYLSGTMLQVKVDYFANALSQAIQAFSQERKPGLKAVENTLSASARKGEHSAVHGAAAVFEAAQLYEITGAQGALTFSKLAGPAGVEVQADGSLRVSGSVPAGIHEVTVNVRAAGTSAFLPKTVPVSVSVLVRKAANGLVAAGKAVSVTYSAAKAASIARPSAIYVSGARGTLSFKKESGDARVSVAADGALAVAKGTPAGTYRVTVSVTASGDADHDLASAKVQVVVTVGKAPNTMTAKAKAKANVVKVKKLARKAQVIKKAAAFKVAKAQGTVSYEKVSGNKGVVVSKAGKLTVRKGLAKGTYRVKVKVTAAGSANYLPTQKVLTLVVKVK